MQTTGRTMHIFYRHVHMSADKISRDPHKQRPDWFSYEACFRNLLHTVRLHPLGDRVRITIIYDGTIEELKSDFVVGYCANPSLGIDVRLIRGGSDKASFLTTLAAARDAAIPDGDLIYFLENDYMHQPGWVAKVFELYDCGLAFDYASLYDHRDKYHLPMYADLRSRLVYSPSHHWRTAPSTCASFIVERSVFRQDLDVLGSGLTDHYFFSKLTGERGRVLLTAVPGLSTHAMAHYLSPTVDWGKLVY